VGRTSIEVEVSIEAEDIPSGMRRHASTAFFVYVALGDDGRAPTQVPQLTLTTDDEHERWQAAQRRQAQRLARQRGSS
jgi:acyl-CoA hydrolase